MSATGVAVVAVDGSEPSVKALVWTLAYAAKHGLRVEVLTVWPLHGPVLLHEVAGHFNQPRWHARDVQEAAMARALAQVEEPPPYELTMDNGTVVDALRRARRRSAVVVIGAGRPGTHRRRRRRLSDLVRDYVPGPVVVVGPAGPVASETLPEAEPTAVDHDAMTV